MAWKRQIFLLINAEPGENDLGSIYEALQDIREVVRVAEVLGEYDIIAVLETDTTDHYTYILKHKIRLIPGITRTVTLLEIPRGE